MSLKTVQVLVCDGCGAEIDMDYYIRIRPEGQPVLQRDLTASPERNFCCEACEQWWHAQFPETGYWGPGWEERAWWHEQVGPHHAVRTAHAEMPMVDVHAHFTDPEPTETV
jgi:hypothetical protein